MTVSIQSEIDRKREALLAWFRRVPSVAVAFSGGVDSSVVMAAAWRVLRDRAVAVTADSPSVPRAELEEARRLAEHLGIRHIVITTDEFTRDEYRSNDGRRCYYCKDELYSRIHALLPQLKAEVICSGANLDDGNDYRPGLRAAAEHHVRHPLQEVGLRKVEVRELARQWQLPVWDKPASPCLASRIAPGVAVTPERTARIELAEAFLRAHGLREFRVRLHDGELARIEVPETEIHCLVAPDFRKVLAQHFRALGFQFVTLDLEGFRSGRFNDLIPLEIRQPFGTGGTT
jgi:uncharacterized protein